MVWAAVASCFLCPLWIYELRMKMSQNKLCRNAGEGAALGLPCARGWLTAASSDTVSALARVPSVVTVPSSSVSYLSCSTPSLCMFSHCQRLWCELISIGSSSPRQFGGINHAAKYEGGSITLLHSHSHADKNQFDVAQFCVISIWQQSKIKSRLR